MMDDDDQLQQKQEEEEEDCGMMVLPGFRFHPTDEELVGFYLRRKVEKRPIAFEIIKQIDIYKYDPWNLPKMSNVGDKEWYFFSMRGRKYKNSIRPNRVITGSGFWKATGIDKPIFSVRQPHQTIIGLKKSLVYYRGTAGKGTKTDWMMHEFRLPPPAIQLQPPPAEVWTLCRILRRVPSYKKYSPAAKGLVSSKPSTKQNSNHDSSSKTCSSSLDSDCSEQCVSFHGIQQYFLQNPTMKPFTVDASNNQSLQHWNNMCNAARSHQFPAMNTNYWNFSNAADDLVEDHANWDELRSVVELALN